jgi:hypothetical protein
MYSILDIDLDYFNNHENPVQRFDSLLDWADRPVYFIVEKHYEVLGQWQKRMEKIGLSSPTHIMHVDEHHDMMDEQAVPNIANMIVHALRRWPQCQVHWLVENPIDYPEMWLSDSTWKSLSTRFSKGASKPINWPKPNLVSVCTSPAFVAKSIRNQLLAKIEET